MLTVQKATTNDASRSSSLASKAQEKNSLAAAPYIGALGIGTSAGALGVGLLSAAGKKQVGNLSTDLLLNFFLGFMADITAIAINKDIRSSAVLGNFLRLPLHYLMSFAGSQEIANKLFQVAGFFIKQSWAMNEDPKAKQVRDNKVGFINKFKTEMNYGTAWLQRLFKKESYTNLAKEIKSDLSFRGAKNFIGKRSSSILVGSAWTGLLGGAILLLDALLKPSNKKTITEPATNEEPKTVLEKVGWFLTKASLWLLTFSYLSKACSRHYQQSNGSLVTGLSLVTFLANGAQAIVADNPQLAQQARWVSSLASLAVSTTEGYKHMTTSRGLTSVSAQ